MRHFTSSVFAPLSLNLPRAGHVLVSGVLLSGGACVPGVQAEEYFDPNAIQLRGDQQAVDLVTLSAGGQLPGTYRVDIIMNGEFYETRDVVFVRTTEGAPLSPTLTAADFRAMGVSDGASAAFKATPDDTVITDIGSLVPSATTQFDFHAQRLNIRVPQAAVDSRARGQVSPSKWDQGMPALLLDYNVSGAESEYNGATSSNTWMGLNSGLNLGAWRLRNQSSWTRSDDTSSWENINTWLQRDIHAIRGQLVMGDSSTPGTVFDSVQFRGVQLYSDDQMLPDSLRGFAPVVRGIAKSDAQVTIRQNGYTIYQRNVAPGPFAITDIYPSAGSGNLEVTVKEADGSESSFIQPFSSVPVMLREGGFKYSLTGGEYRSGSDHATTPGFMEGSVIYGLNNHLTLYTGTRMAENYRSLLVGAGIGLGDFGSVSFDATQARSTLDDDSTHNGQSYSFEYAKDVFQSGTTFTLAGYRYSTEGFYDFSEVNEITEGDSEDWRRGYNKRSKLSLTVSQSLGDYGSLYVSGYQQDYWQSDDKERTLNVGYNGSYKGISYSLNASSTRVPGSDTDKSLALSVSVPLDKWMPSAWASYSVNTDSNSRTRHSVGLSGTALEQNNLSYSVTESYANQGVGNGGYASASYRGAYGTVNGGYSYGKDSSRLNYGASGAVVVHPYGVTLGQSTGDTTTLVRAPGADGVNVQGKTGVSTDWRGYALVPYATPYRGNRISLDPGSLGDKVDLDTSVKTVVPTKGALVLADFDTRVGERALVTLTVKGKPVPFGATASLVRDGKTNMGIVGPDGEVYLSGLPQKGQLNVSWGAGADEQCVATFTLPSTVGALNGVRQLSAVCQ